jgi:hypothetical protein
VKSPGGVIQNSSSEAVLVAMLAARARALAGRPPEDAVKLVAYGTSQVGMVIDHCDWGKILDQLHGARLDLGPCCSVARRLGNPRRAAQHSLTVCGLHVLHVCRIQNSHGSRCSW